LKTLAFFVLFLTTNLSCSAQPEIRTIADDRFELILTNQPKAVLVLFPGYFETRDNIKIEAKKIVDDALGADVAVLLMAFNQHLYLTQPEKQNLNDWINEALGGIGDVPFYLGGFSSGGNVALLLANHMASNKEGKQPSGVFVVDSPVDIERLYQAAQKDIKRNVNGGAVSEGRMIISTMDNALGTPADSLHNYEAVSPYLFSKHNTHNVAALKNVKMRLYTEPALDWQQTNRQRTYEDLNAFMLENLSLDLKNAGFKHVEFITTENKGYRVNGGHRHPHSWSIVDGKALVSWMLGSN
jgi:Thioesterase domain